jgi:hypothetical protein
MENRRLVLGLLLSVALFTGPAFAAQNVANTSQKGSLLKFPNIDVRDEDSATTTIEISNDLNIGVNLTCVYVTDGLPLFHLSQRNGVLGCPIRQRGRRHRAFEFSSVSEWRFVSWRSW